MLENQTFDKANDTLYSFLLTDLPSVITRDESRSLLLNCNTVFLPGVSIGVSQVRFLGGYINTPSNDLKFDDMTMIFLIDEHMENGKTLFNGMMFMHNNKDKFAVAGDEPVVMGVLSYYNNGLNVKVLEIEYWKLGPTTLSQITLSTKTDGSQVLEASVTFTFDRAELKS